MCPRGTVVCQGSSRSVLKAFTALEKWMAEDSMQTPSPVFGTPTLVFGTGATPNNNDHMSMDNMAEDSMQTPTSVFGTPSPRVFGTGATSNNNDHMSIDSMAEDSMQTPTPVPAFGQTLVASPGFMWFSHPNSNSK
ncbi:hypothetical protein Tco_0099085 [Tanacetum coccineum]